MAQAEVPANRNRPQFKDDTALRTQLLLQQAASSCARWPARRVYPSVVCLLSHPFPVLLWRGLRGVAGEDYTSQDPLQAASLKVQPMGDTGGMLLLTFGLWAASHSPRCIFSIPATCFS